MNKSQNYRFWWPSESAGGCHAVTTDRPGPSETLTLTRTNVRHNRPDKEPDPPATRWYGLWVRPADRCDELVDCLVSERSHLVVAAVLNRVLDEESGRVEAKCGRLRLGCGHERARSYEDAGKAAALEVGDVMHTA